MTTPNDRSPADNSSITNNGAISKHSKNSKHPKKQLSTMMWWLMVILTVVIFAMIFYMGGKRTKEEPIETITRAGVVTQIQQLNRLQTVVFSVDTVITSQRQGSWTKLWQDQQKGLFIARGRVEAGIDLRALTPEMVQVVQPTEQLADNDAQGIDANVPISILPQINITLPPSEIFSVYLDDIEIYDWQTGVFGMMQVDPKILAQAQSMAKKEVLERACRGDIMIMALQNAQTQLQQLFSLTGAVVTVTTQGAGACQMPSVTP